MLIETEDESSYDDQESMEFVYFCQESMEFMHVCMSILCSGIDARTVHAHMLVKPKMRISTAQDVHLHREQMITCQGRPCGRPPQLPARL